MIQTYNNTINNNSSVVLRMGEVYSNNDPYGGGRVQIRIYEDNTRVDADIPWAFPLLPQFIHIVPQRGELCLLICDSVEGLIGDHPRFYVGGFAPQIDNIASTGAIEAQSFFKKGLIDYHSNPYNVPNSQGAFPEYNNEELGEVVAMLGKHNTDIIHKDNEIWIRVSPQKKNNNNRIEFNENVSFIKMKDYSHYDGVKGEISYRHYNLDKPLNPSSEGEKVQFTTAATIVADEINLISSSANSNTKIQGINLHDNQEMIKDSDMVTILENAHRLPYGDELIKFLDMLRKAIVSIELISGDGTRVTGFHPDTNEINLKEVLIYPLEEMLSKNIRIT